MNLKSVLKETLVLFILGILLIPIISVRADDATNIEDASVTIKGVNYRIDESDKGDKVIYLSDGATIELTGGLSDGNIINDYRIVVEENASVSITLNNYQALVNRGWSINTIELQNGSNVRITLIGENRLIAGPEASAIRVPKNTSLVIDGDGTLNAEVRNGGSGASSAVIGGKYSDPFGDITINGGNIYTHYTGGGYTTGIGSGNYGGVSSARPTEEMSGNITLNGGNIHTDVLGSSRDEDKVHLKGNGNATVYTDNLFINDEEFSGIVFNEDGNRGTVKGDVVLNHDMNIEPGTVLTVEDGASLTIPENVTVTNNGKIVNEGNITNNGTLQNNEGIIDNTNGNITSTTDIENVDGNVLRLYNVTVNVGDGGTVNPNQSFKVEHGQTQVFDILPNKGYKIKSVIVNGKDKTNEVINGKLTLENITKDISINVEFEKLSEVQRAIPINKDNVESPETKDNILLYVVFELISAIGIGVLRIYYKVM